MVSNRLKNLIQIQLEVFYFEVDRKISQRKLKNSTAVLITAEIARKYWPWNRILWPWRKLASDKWWPENHRAQHLWKYPFYLQVLNKSIIYIGEWESETLLVMHFDLLAVNFGHLPRTKTYQLKSIDHFSLDDPWEMGFLFIQYSKLREWPKASLWPSAPETKWKGPVLTKLTFGCIFFFASLYQKMPVNWFWRLYAKSKVQKMLSGGGFLLTSEWRILPRKIWRTLCLTQKSAKGLQFVF